jgi:hypothetical protein
MKKMYDLIEHLEMNVALSVVMFKDMGMDRSKIIKTCAKIDKLIMDEALALNDGKEDLYTINIGTTLAMLILLKRINMINELYDGMAKYMGVNRDLFDQENKTELMAYIDEIMNKKN